MARGRIALGLSFVCALGTLAFFRGCAVKDGCSAGDDGTCVPRSPCEALAYTCSAPELAVRTITSPNDRPPGVDALAAPGDLLLENDRVRLVLDGLGAPHYISPSGGGLLDFVPRGASGSGDDELNHVYQATGILPGDAVHYTRIEIDDHAPTYVAAILRGKLEGRPRVTVVTRYELRPCEPGVRVRTELFHGGREPETFFLSDAFYWGGREVVPFAPAPGRGFLHPDLDLLELGKSFVDHPFFAARPERDGAAAYSAVACGTSGLSGFHSTSISATGLPRTIVMPGDSLSFERFLMVSSGPGLGGAADLALEAREKLHGERTISIRGRVTHPDGRPPELSERTSLLVYAPGEGADPDSEKSRTPWTEVVPAADGTFHARVPSGKSLRIAAHALGRPLPFKTSIGASQIDANVPDIVLPDLGILEAHIVDGAGKPVQGEIVLTPTQGSAANATRGSTHGVFDEAHCTPWLGPAHGGSPACNRALVESDGRVRLVVPTGTYFVYATQGPFATLSRAEIIVEAGKVLPLKLVVEKLPGLVPDGALSADFHVHGGASFDSSLPDRDRARTFVATGIDVLAATDHDVVTTYGQAIRDLGLADRVHVMAGAETTGHILFYEPPGAEIPKVVGHYNFWPLRHDTALPRNGLPWDELLEPGPLFDRVSASFEGRGVIQFNHPLAGSSFGRDEGFLTAIEYDVRTRIPSAASNAGPGQLRRSNGGRTALDYHVQEVMNGTGTRQFHDYRLAWFSFLNQGILRGGTANSDSHTLATEVLGYPRNLVFGGHSLVAFDTDRFNEDVRSGHSIGTNGPVIVASVGTAGSGTVEQGPSLTPFRTSADASLSIEVRAAPWIPVEEIRILVNGRVARTIGGASIFRPRDPFGKEGLVRFSGKIPLATLLAALPPTKDAWIVVEAGLPLVFARDLDDDGRPETTDNNRDGVIDAFDHVGRSEDDYYVEPGRPDVSDARFHAQVVAPGHWSTAFTNPWLVDRNGDGWTAPGL